MKPVKYHIVPYTMGRGIEINPSPETGKLFTHFIGADADQLYLFATGVLDFVFSQNMNNGTVLDAWRVIKPGGYLVIYGNGKVVEPIERGFDMLVSERIRGEELTVLKKRSDKRVNLAMRKYPDKSCCVIRYGGIGDMMQTASILPGLKEQGYYVVLNTDPQGYEMIQHDPHIDEFILQEKNQVPNQELGAWWNVLDKKFKKLVNLCESVEGTFLALPGRMQYYWPKELRHKYLNVNYMEHIHELAGVPLPTRERFYPTPKEMAWAKKQRRRIPGKVILWTLAGSSVHKYWPYMDQLIARIMVEYKDVYVVLVGDTLCQLIEAGWENEPRVIMQSGKWSVRETLSFAEFADLIIGPETGTMNAMAVRDIPKMMFLSHSSIENLTKHWVNCISLEPEDCDCYPCHQLHYNFDPCPRDEDLDVAKCQALISVDRVWDEIKKMF